ncbi:MAG: acetolactate synthase small subunit [Candidatus Dadabacteria bacterium]|nr:MAG: acetolactate synthase small subunit [Candidatus Dadabacteria bacterium]
MRHTIAVWVQNEFGVLTRVANLFSGRGFNIESLCVAPTEDPEISRITMVTRGDDAVIDQIIKQLRRLLPVHRVEDMTGFAHVERELVLVKVRADDETRTEVTRLVEIFRCKIIDASHDTFVIEVTGDAGKIEAFLNLLKPMGIKEIARSGAVAMVRTAADPDL